MDKKNWQIPFSKEEQTKALARKTDELRQRLMERDPLQLAEMTGCRYENGIFTLTYFNQTVNISFPELRATKLDSETTLPIAAQAMIMYYFATADGSLPDGSWSSFADLPGGRIYNQAYQGYTGDLLARSLGEDLSRFERSALSLMGERVFYGDMSFSFCALPRVSLLAVLWQGDEDFPATGKILFDATVVHYLPIDACAILGSMLTLRLIK